MVGHTSISGVCVACASDTFKAAAGVGSCKACGSFGAPSSAGVGHGVTNSNTGAGTCSARPRAVVGLAALTFSLLTVLAVLFKCRADVRTMSWLKLQTLAFAMLDFFSDGYYLATAEYAMYGLQVASLTVFILPTIAFCMLDTGTVSAVLANARASYVRKVTGGETWNDFNINTFGTFVKTTLRGVLWALPMLVLASLTIVLLMLAINCKLFALDTLAKGINDMTGAGAAGDAKAMITVTSVNLSLACELLLESFPQLFIMIKNNQMLGEGGGFAFYFSVLTSALAILNGVWPIGFWMKKKGSFMGGLEVELFDKWTCAVCGEKVGATTLKCTEDSCNGKHPELRTKGRLDAATPHTVTSAGLGDGAGERSSRTEQMARSSKPIPFEGTEHAIGHAIGTQQAPSDDTGPPGLPAGWRVVYENIYTGERVQTLPTEPAHDLAASTADGSVDAEAVSNATVAVHVQAVPGCTV
jgi:hypothetical protein